MNRITKVALMIAADLLALPLCFLIAMLLRLGDFESTLRYGVASPVLIALLTISAFTMSGLYRAVIRFIDQRLLTTAGIGLAVALLIVYFFSLSFSDTRLPNSALMIYWFIAFSYVVTSRLMVRAFLRIKTDKQCQIEKRVAIYGAGEPGAQLALAMRVSDEYRPVCFFDEKHVLTKHTIASLTVFHSDLLLAMVKELRIGLVVIAIPSV
ncbi:MAG: polysaccharide biosynthesis protein, partial [Oxalobacteraceae bacterium]